MLTYLEIMILQRNKIGRPKKVQFSYEQCNAPESMCIVNENVTLDLVMFTWYFFLKKKKQHCNINSIFTNIASLRYSQPPKYFLFNGTSIP